MRPYAAIAAANPYWAASLLTAMAMGCSQQPASNSNVEPHATPVVAAVVRSELTAKGQPKETWDALFLSGAKVGYSRTTIADVVENGAKHVRIDSTNTVVVNRSAQRTEHTIVATGIETPEGRLVRFFTRLQSGANSTTFNGRVDGNDLVVITETAGKSTTSRIPWPANAGGFLAMEQSLLRQPMQPGERRKLIGLMSVVNQPVTMELMADKIEPTRLLQHSEDLLRVDCHAKLPDGKPIVERVWVGRDGAIQKRQIDALAQETYRTTKEIALADIGPGKFDLMLDTTVRVNRALENPHATRRIRYRVQLKTNDPAQVFAAGGTQDVAALDSRTAEVVVRSIRPGPADGINSKFAATATGLQAGVKAPAAALSTPAAAIAPPKEPPVSKGPTDADRKPNSIVQSDYPKIVTMAQAAGEATDPWAVALRLEKAVQSHLRRTSYAQAFATAAEVAEHPEGDCTEYAVLLAAMCRARGIPARVAVGLVYVSAAQGFGYHMWNEVWIDGQWIPLDATLAQGGVGAAHLKLADSNLEGTNAFSTFLSVAQVIGQLRLEIVEVE